jgi:hypothetical protein
MRRSANNVKNLTRSSLLLTVVAGLAAVAFAGQQTQPPNTDSQTPTTIEGLVRDIACPIQNHKSTATEFNLECALSCAKKGSPLIILTKQGDMYTPMSESMPDTDQRHQLMPFVGKFVKVTGTVYERNGTRAIAIKTIVEDKDQHLKTDLK